MKCKKCPGWEECVLREGDQCVKDPKKYTVLLSGRHSGKNAYDDLLEIVEKALKALEIIKEKEVNVFIFLHSGDLETYNDMVEDNRKLTQEEYDLLKEALK